MTRTSDTFGALALATLTVFALWSSTLTIPAASASAPDHQPVTSAPVA